MALLARFVPALCLILAACGPVNGGQATVSDAWVRLPAVAGRPGAAYFTLTGGRAAQRLVSVESPVATRIELHHSSMVAGQMTMQRLDGVDLARHATVKFAPEGNHAMLFGIAPDAKAGGTTRLTFRFEKGAPVTVEARVTAAGDADPY